MPDLMTATERDGFTDGLVRDSTLAELATLTRLIAETPSRDKMRYVSSRVRELIMSVGGE